MAYPRLEIDLTKIQRNASHLVNICRNNGIEVMGITKGVCALNSVVNAMMDGGIGKLGDSRLSNIAQMRNSGVTIPIYLIRNPMLSEVTELVELADGSLNSELKILKAISDKALAIGKKHNVILMIDVGDLREGVMPEDAVEMAGEIIGLPGIRFEGLGTNMGCYGGIKASFENTKILVDLSQEIQKKYGIKIKTLSGGNTATLALLEKGRLAPGINQLRLGESILLGTDVNNFRRVPGTLQKTMLLKAEVVEVKSKPSYPIGEIGRDAFGNIPAFRDKGIRKRAIVALGKQDCRIEGLKPVNESIEILGASSDHLLLDVTHCPEIEVGSIIKFNVDYSAMLSLMTSKYVEKICDIDSL